ncbi:hypothetical protein IWQ61_004335 [Dispira simplex]|nr:hypothetical protein IWQ61_004335 [Dispira simplex]
MDDFQLQYLKVVQTQEPRSTGNTSQGTPPALPTGSFSRELRPAVNFLLPSNDQLARWEYIATVLFNEVRIFYSPTEQEAYDAGIENPTFLTPFKPEFQTTAPARLLVRLPIPSQNVVSDVNTLVNLPSYSSEEDSDLEILDIRDHISVISLESLEDLTLEGCKPNEIKQSCSMHIPPKLLLDMVELLTRAVQYSPMEIEQRLGEMDLSELQRMWLTQFLSCQSSKTRMVLHPKVKTPTIPGNIPNTTPPVGPYRFALTGTENLVVQQLTQRQLTPNRNLHFQRMVSSKVPWKHLRTLHYSSGETIELHLVKHEGSTLFSAASWADIAMDYNKSGNLLVGNVDEESVQYIPGHQSLIERREDYYYSVTGTRLIPHSQTVLSCAVDLTFQVHHWQQPQHRVYHYRVHDNPCKLVTYDSCDTTLAATCCNDGTVYLFSVDIQGTVPTDPALLDSKSLHQRPLSDALFIKRPNARPLLATAHEGNARSATGRLNVWDIETYQNTQHFYRFPRSALCIDYHAPSDLIYVATGTQSSGVQHKKPSHLASLYMVDLRTRVISNRTGILDRCSNIVKVR